MFFNSNSGTINTTAAIATFLTGILIALTVALFHYYYFPQKFNDEKASEISGVFQVNRDFPATAKRLLSSRNDVAYLKLLDQNGVLEESFGNDDIDGTSRYLVNAPENKTVVIGLRKYSAGEIDSYALVWSVLIGAVVSFALIFFLFLQSPKQDKALKRLESAMERVSDGDLTARLDIDSSTDEEMGIMSAYQSFNRMVNTLNRKFGDNTEQYTTYEEHYDQTDESSQQETYQYSPFSSSQNTRSEEETSDYARESESEEEKQPYESTDDYPGEETAYETETTDEEQEKVVDLDQYENREKTEETEEEQPDTGEFRPRIILPDTSQEQAKKRMVTAFVAKISDFEQLTEQLNSSELNSFLTSYRKAASTIIGDYGGVIEALLQDEIVALFNAPDEQNKPELRSICAAVEVLQVLAKMSKDRRDEGKPVISGKIGIDLDTVAFSTGSGIPNSVKNIVSNARGICENSDIWKVQVSEQLYEIVRDHVEVKENTVDSKTVYSIVGVEEGVIEL